MHQLRSAHAAQQYVQQRVKAQAWLRAATLAERLS